MPQDASDLLAAHCCLHPFWCLHRLISIIASKQLTENCPLSLRVYAIKYQCVALSLHNWLLCFVNRFDNLGIHPCRDRWLAVSLWSSAFILAHLLRVSSQSNSSTTKGYQYPFCVCRLLLRQILCIKFEWWWHHWRTSVTIVRIMSLSAVMFWRYNAKLQWSPISQKWHRLTAGQRKPFVGVQGC